MKRKQKINVLNVLLVITALGMMVIGYSGKILAPAVTGIGFVLIAWMLNTLNRE